MDHVTIDPAVRSGKPCIRDTRITVYDVLEYRAGGMTGEEILQEFPELTADDIQQLRIVTPSQFMNNWRQTHGSEAQYADHPRP